MVKVVCTEIKIDVFCNFFFKQDSRFLHVAWYRTDKRNKRGGCVPCDVSWNLLEGGGRVGACIWKKCNVCVVLKLYKAYHSCLLELTSTGLAMQEHILIFHTFELAPVKCTNLHLYTLRKAIRLAGRSRRGQRRSLCRPDCGLHGRDSIPFHVHHVQAGCGGTLTYTGCYGGLIIRGKTAGALIRQHF